LSFDLVGLPPTPEEIDQYVADPDPLAYEKLVERLLASPQYGERWARHWLDVVHYGDSHGYDKDKPRPNAWPYRDYVIRSFNDDKPYARFLREQIAGDVLFPDKADGVIATGFLAAGPWDFISHVEVPETKIDGQVARSLDRDDVVRSVMETFASTTVGCARCHSHKFDPITQADYYGLQAVFAAIDRADRPVDSDPRITHERRDLAAARNRAIKEAASAAAERKAIEDAELADVRKGFEAFVASHPQKAEFGYHSGIDSREDAVKWVQVDLGRAVPINAVILAGCYDAFAGIGPGFGFPIRFRIEAANDPAFERGVMLIADRTGADVPNPGVHPQRFETHVNARYVRVTATKLMPRQSDFIFALAELLVLGPDGKNIASGSDVASLDSVDAPPRWQRSNLTDGIWFGSNADPAFQTTLVPLQEERAAALARIETSAASLKLAEAEQRLAKVEEKIAALPKPQLVYAAATEFASEGNFKPTHGRPREIRVLRRGDVNSPGELARPGALTAIGALPGSFELPSGHGEGDRRIALADWLANRDNPLTWRSIANRVWLYHFGRGIVDTPNDFGRMGQVPSHPELLDWLAVELRDSGGSLKHLHRLIVTSAAYQQSSSSESAESASNDPESVDAENRLLWKMNRRRIEAEEVRDAVLAAAGMLETQMFGPAFQDFVIEKPEHSPHYLYAKHDPADAATHRRTIYRFIVRSQPQPFLGALDCADASMSVDKRNETVTPLQALALLNNPFMVEMSEQFSERLATVQPDDMAGQIELAFRIAFGRAPVQQEQNRLLEYAQEHGLANVCRIIFNLNEFVYVD
jgi:hypothetical protein